jgi:hypothetical protein
VVVAAQFTALKNPPVELSEDTGNDEVQDHEPPAFVPTEKIAWSALSCPTAIHVVVAGQLTSSNEPNCEPSGDVGTGMPN